MPIVWHEEPNGFAASGFRIRPVEGREELWQLDAAPYRLSSPGHSVGTTFHDTVGEAMRWAEWVDGERRTRARIRGHVVIGLVAAIAFAIAGSIVNGVPLFVLAVVSAYVALKSFVNAIAIVLGDVWSWTRDGGVKRPASRADRLLERWIAAIEGPPDWDAIEPAGPVVEVDPRDHPFPGG